MPPTRRRLLGVLAFAALMLAPAVAFASGGEEPTWPWYLQFAGSIVNFALLVFLIVRFAGPKLSGFLKQRQETIERQMRESAELRDKAKSQLDEIEQKLGGLEAERKRLLDEYRRAGEEEKARIIANAEKQARRIREEAELSAETERARARVQLEREVAERAIALAEQTLRERIQPAKQKQTIDQGIAQIESLAEAQH